MLFLIEHFMLVAIVIHGITVINLESNWSVILDRLSR